MRTLFNLLRTLLITSIFSFFAPLLLIGATFFGLMLVKHIPFLELISTIGLEQLLHFLVIFGTGSAIRGVLTISLVSSLVGILFDTYIFYRYQILRSS
jgi:hypothetical protein